MYVTNPAWSVEGHDGESRSLCKATILPAGGGAEELPRPVTRQRHKRRAALDRVSVTPLHELTSSRDAGRATRSQEEMLSLSRHTPEVSAQSHKRPPLVAHVSDQTHAQVVYAYLTPIARARARSRLAPCGLAHGLAPARPRTTPYITFPSIASLSPHTHATKHGHKTRIGTNTRSRPRAAAAPSSPLWLAAHSMSATSRECRP